MSIHALPAPEPVLTPLVGRARGALVVAAEIDLGLLAVDELAEAVEALTEVARRAEALRLAVLAQADQQQVAESTAATGTDAWAAALTGDRREVLAGGLRLAHLLRTRYDATRTALAAGRISIPQARVIVDAAEQAPDDATPDQVAQAELGLVDKATGDSHPGGRPMDARRLRRAARRMFAPLDPDLAARHEAALLGRDHRAAEGDTYLQLDDNGNGTWSGRFCVPDLAGHLLHHALGRLTAPRRLGRVRGRGATGDAGVVVDASAPGTDWGVGLHEAQGAAFCELLEHLPTDALAPVGVTMLVTTTVDALREGLVGAGVLDTDAAITASEARRLACGAGIVPAVLDGASQPLDLGRSQRLHSPAQRRALSLTHDSCGIDTCQRPFAWCEVHHPVPWAHGGRTDLANAVPLCGHHHRRAHDERFDLRRQPGGGWRLLPRTRGRSRSREGPAPPA